MYDTITKLITNTLYSTQNFQTCASPQATPPFAAAISLPTKKTYRTFFRFRRTGTTSGQSQPAACISCTIREKLLQFKWQSQCFQARNIIMARAVALFELFRVRWKSEEEDWFRLPLNRTVVAWHIDGPFCRLLKWSAVVQERYQWQLKVGGFYWWVVTNFKQSFIWSIEKISSNIDNIQVKTPLMLMIFNQNQKVRIEENWIKSTNVKLKITKRKSEQYHCWKLKIAFPNPRFKTHRVKD